jgi:bifunctional UDP-N-acetylglucosamine pyrophosphorylase / glucosamine-1-phosphate N-acetyltransferase
VFDLTSYLIHWNETFPDLSGLPWEIVNKTEQVVSSMVQKLDTNFSIKDDIAIHKSAIIEEHCVMKGPIIISQGCFIGAHAYLRGGVFLGPRTSIGPGCEVKASLILQDSALAHFNFVGDSILGAHVNLEAGAVLANHHNDRKDKIIEVLIDHVKMSTGVEKFGSLVGDNSKIGANSVLSPGTILSPNTMVKRLTLIAQC